MLALTARDTFATGLCCVYQDSPQLVCKLRYLQVVRACYSRTRFVNLLPPPCFRAFLGEGRQTAPGGGEGSRERCRHVDLRT